MKKNIIEFSLVWILIIVFTLPLFAQTDDIPPEFLLFGEEKIIVTAARHEQKIGKAPAAINVITTEDIKNSGLLTVGDILRSLPGIDVRNAGTKLYLAPRGLAGTVTNRVICLVDGRPINTPLYGSFFPDLTLPLVNIKRIEVIRGPGSAIYGANAFAGVINIITKSPEDVDGFEISVSGGEFSTQLHKVSLGGKSEKIAGLFTGRWYKTDGSKLIADNTDFENYNVYGKMKVSDFTLSFGHHETDRGLPGNEIRPTPANTEEVKESFVDGIGNIELNSEMDLMVRGYINDRENVLDMNGLKTVNETVLGGEIQHNWQINPSNLFICGVDLRNDVADSEEALGGKHETTNTAIYLQNECRLIDKLIVILGGRYDAHFVYGDLINPRVGAVYNLGRSVLKTSYGEAFRAPTFVELYADTWHGPIMHMVGNKELKPEKIKTYEIGLGHKFTRSLEGEINAFYNKTSDLIAMRTNVVILPGPPIPVTEFGYENKDKIETKGFEVEIKNELFSNNLKGFINYSYQEAKDEETGEDLDYAPNHKFNLGLNLKVTNACMVNTIFHYVGERNYSAGELDAYTVTDSKLSAKVLEDLELSISIYNIFDERYEETKYYPMPGRSWLAEVGYKF
jgi:outer membrane cobalamin receptor